MKAKNKSKSLTLRTVEAVKRFLERKDYKILEVDEKATPCQIIALDADESTIAFIHTDYMVEVKEDEVGDFDKQERGLKRRDFEKQAIKWLATNDDYIDVAVRFDSVIVDIVATDRALLRQHINVFGEVAETESSIVDKSAIRVA